MTATPAPDGVDPYERVRALCLALPGTSERPSHGAATWFVGKRTFVSAADLGHDDRRALWLAAPAGVQESLVDTDPDRFFRPPYVGRRGWLGVYLDVPTDWDELEALIVDAHRLIGSAARR